MPAVRKQRFEPLLLIIGTVMVLAVSAVCFELLRTRERPRAPTSPSRASLVKAQSSHDLTSAGPQTARRLPTTPSSRARVRAKPIAKPAAVGKMEFSDAVAAWSTQSSDADWSRNVYDQLHAMLTPDELADDIVRGVDCRETLCELQLDGGRLDTLIRLQREISEGGGGFAYRIQDGDGGKLVRAIVDRETF